MKASEEFLPVVFFIMLFKVVLILESVYEIQKCGYSDESYWEVLSSLQQQSVVLIIVGLWGCGKCRLFLLQLNYQFILSFIVISQQY